MRIMARTSFDDPFQGAGRIDKALGELVGST